MSDVWGTVYQLERDKATGNDPDSLRRENERLRAENGHLRDVLASAREKLVIYHKQTDGMYGGGVPVNLLLERIDKATDQ